MTYKMFSTGLVVLAFVGMSLCQQLQLNAGLQSQYLPSYQRSSEAVQQAPTKFENIENQSDNLPSIMTGPQKSQSYQNAVQQQHLAQPYQTAFGNTGVQHSIFALNSYHGNQDNQQYYIPATQKSAEPQFITKESYPVALPAVISAAIPVPVQPEYKQHFNAPTQTQQEMSTTNAAQAQQEYKYQQFASLAQAQPEYKQQFTTLTQTQQDITAANAAQARHEYKNHQQFASLVQAQIEYKQQLAALEQAQQELKQQIAAPVQTREELKQQFAVLVQAQQEYKQQFSALAQTQKEYKQQFAALNEAQQELKQQFVSPIQTQLEYKQQFDDLEHAQLEFKQQFAALIQAQQELKKQLAASAQVLQEYKQRFTAPTQQVYRQQYAVPDQGRQDDRQRFVVPIPTHQYIQKSTTTTANGSVNYSHVAEYPDTKIKAQTVATVQPRFQYSAMPQQYYYTVVPAGQVAVTEPPRVQQPATNQSLSGVVISTTPTPLKESVVYKSESTLLPQQQPPQRKVDNFRNIA